MRSRTVLALPYFGPAVPLVVAALALLIMQRLPAGADGQLIATGLTVDLTVISPIIYLMLIRRSTIPNITVIPVFIFGILIAGAVIPMESQQALTWIKLWVLPIVELAVIGVIGYHFIMLRAAIREEQNHQQDFFTALKSATGKVLPSRAGDFLAMELATFYYGFLHWKKPPTYGYTYHKVGGTIAMLTALTLLIPVETVVLHLLIQKWSDTAAWIFTIISIYTAVQLWGMTRSVMARPTEILAEEVVVRFGILAEVHIPLGEIAEVEKLTYGQPPTSAQKISPIANFEGCNVILRCKKEQVIFGVYGFKRRGRDLAFNIDNADRFVKEVQQKIARIQ